MKKFSSLFIKRRRTVFVLSLLNCVIYALYFSSLVTFGGILLEASVIVLAPPLILMMWGLGSDSTSRFINATILYVVTFIFIGIPLSFLFYNIAFNAYLPDLRPNAGSGIGMMLVMFYYTVMSIIAWVVSLILSWFLEWSAHDRE